MIEQRRPRTGRAFAAIWALSVPIGCGTPVVPAPSSPPPAFRITIDRDDIVVRDDCTLVPSDRVIRDVEDDGVILIVGSDLEVVIDGTLLGSTSTTPPDRREGIGIVIVGDRVRLRGGGVHGFRVGVEVRGDDVVVDGVDLSHQRAQRLRSTKERADPTDRLRPHVNDQGEWAASYGAGIRVAGGRAPTLRALRVRDAQNGILLEGVEGATVFDCDCSFLSGWGIALWRTTDSVIARNAFDFCVRGYSHQVYNRGHDSAGILLFEQCERNLVMENSATHGGDGIFGFAGREALGQKPPPSRSDDDGLEGWYTGRGNSDNVFIGNDLSHAAVHGFEMTFSRGWRLEGNRLHDNAICGAWAGYSSFAVIRGNDFADNGSMGFGTEGGGLNIEQGVGNRIERNVFRANTEGVELWWAADSMLASTPWGRANDLRSTDNEIVDNRFIDCGTAIDLRDSTGTRIRRNLIQGGATGLRVRSSPGLELRGNRFECPQPVIGASLLENGRAVGPSALTANPPPTPEIPGSRRPVGARRHLAGRDRIVMTEWGPYDWETSLLRREPSLPGRHVWSLLGPSNVGSVSVIEGDVLAVVDESLDKIIVRSRSASGLAPYRIRAFPIDGEPTEASDHLIRTDWLVQAFPTTVDPREDGISWLRDRDSADLVWNVDELDLRFGMDGPCGLAQPTSLARSRNRPGRDRFGIVATTRLRLPEGRYLLRTLSDDGIRVRIDDRTVIENWTWHGPTGDVAVFTVPEEGEISIEVEHFELDGSSVLKVELEPADG